MVEQLVLLFEVLSNVTVYSYGVIDNQLSYRPMI